MYVFLLVLHFVWTFHRTSRYYQVIELYTEDGCDRPFFCILKTPEWGNVVRVVNTAPVEFPLTASVVPHTISDRSDDFLERNAIFGGDVVVGGNAGPY